MATNANWTIVFEDKLIIKQSGDGAKNGYRDETPHSSFADANIGDINQFSSKWDSAHLIKLQSDWDGNNVDGETEAEKISRLSARPTSYSS